MITNTFQIFTDTNIDPAELANLMASVGWVKPLMTSRQLNSLYPLILLLPIAGIPLACSLVT